MGRNGNYLLKVAGFVLLTAVTFGGVIAFAVNVNSKADTAVKATEGQETRLRAVELTLPAMAADIKAIRDLMERELQARKETP